jgi:hypothetical protein
MKKVLFILILSLAACKKTQVIPTPSQPDINIFDIKESSVKNGQTINFTLPVSGTYTLTMMDTIKNQVVTRERFIGKVGLNSLKIYTNSLPTKYLSVELKDQNNQQIGKTRIIIN